jgi:hypothetical protein
MGKKMTKVNAHKTNARALSREDYMALLNAER